MTNTKPTDADWLAVGNDFRKVLGLPLYNRCDTGITEDVLNEYDSILPGARARLEAMAQKEMEHRLEMEKLVNELL